MADVRFHFVDEWSVAADPEVVGQVVHDVARWPGWWPSVQDVTQLDGEDGAALPGWRLTFRTRLPYSMQFDSRVRVDEKQRGLDTTITGAVEGTGRWHVQPIHGGALVRFDWDVRPRRRWMRLASPVARPVFLWNHRAVMREGGQALAVRLDTTALTEPRTQPAVAPSAAAVAVATVAATVAAAACLRALRRATTPTLR